ncbi:hypothetical protein BSLA_02f2209 [Burkholderia stabilis]|nr:hypothetical protein BSLA_02f2209 [Burkholderia stabilis]
MRKRQGWRTSRLIPWVIRKGDTKAATAANAAIAEIDRHTAQFRVKSAKFNVLNAHPPDRS